VIPFALGSVGPGDASLYVEALRRDPRFFETKRVLEAKVVVTDNIFPPAFRPGTLLFVPWHGFGWKNPYPNKRERGLGRAFYRDLARRTKLWWTCFGPTDYEQAVRDRGLAPENYKLWGSPYAAKLARAVPQVRQKPLVVFAGTWHHGGSWMPEHFARPSEYDLVFRLHDKKRYPAEYLKRIEGCGASVSFKDEQPDHFELLRDASVLVSDYSSILNYWYYTGKPSVHLLPSDVSTFRYQEGRSTPTKSFWKVDPQDVGGLIGGPSTILDALADPDCCKLKAASFIERHMQAVDDIIDPSAAVDVLYAGVR
jgi:hypothetical protein